MSLDEGRKHDLVEIEKGLHDKDPLTRHDAREAADKIKLERFDGRIGQLRRELIQERQKDKNGNVRQISENIYKHQHGGFGRTSFGFSFPDDFWKK